MDLTSLPAEMLASILKYSKFETVTRIRKISQQIDQASIRYELNKPQVYRIVADADENLVSVAFCDAEIWETKRNSEEELSKGSFNCIVELNESDNIRLTWQKYSRKVRCVTFELHYVAVDAEWLQLLATCANPQKVSVDLLECNFQIPVAQLTGVLAKYKESGICEKPENTTLEGTVASDEVICSLLCTMSSFEFNRSFEQNVVKLLDITDKCLQTVCELKPQNFYLGSYLTSFTLPEVIKTLKNVMNSQLKGHWNVGYLKFRTALELKMATADFKSIQNVTVTEWKANETLIEETNFMKSLSYHPHLVSMLGYVSDARNRLLLVEICDQRDLLHLIRQHKQEIQLGPANFPNGLKIRDLLSFSWQISNGLDYLNSVGCIHCDLAARNVLVDSSNVCKAISVLIAKIYKETRVLEPGQAPKHQMVREKPGADGLAKHNIKDEQNATNQSKKSHLATAPSVHHPTKYYTSPCS